MRKPVQPPALSKANHGSVLPAKVTQNEARRRKEFALARLREIEVAQREGELIPADQVRDHWVTILATVKAGVLRIPDRCAAMLEAVDTKEARRILTRECEAALKGLHDEIAASAR